jgi:hypothetical protein
MEDDPRQDLAVWAPRRELLDVESGTPGGVAVAAQDRHSLSNGVVPVRVEEIDREIVKSGAIQAERRTRG